MRGRGLKSTYAEISTASGLSLPMRGRGLKYRKNRIKTSGFQVAPHAGAWIEMWNMALLSVS